jgi:hypothetical protein
MGQDESINRTEDVARSRECGLAPEDVERVAAALLASEDVVEAISLLTSHCGDGKRGRTSNASKDAMPGPSSGGM